MKAFLCTIHKASQSNEYFALDWVSIANEYSTKHCFVMQPKAIYDKPAHSPPFYCLTTNKLSNDLSKRLVLSHGYLELTKKNLSRSRTAIEM